MANLKPIMIIDDNEIDISMVELIINNSNIQNPLVKFFNGREALDYMLDEGNLKPCIVLLDLNMPVMNGLEFIKEGREKKVFEEVKIIIFTSTEDEEARLNSLNLGAIGYIHKPFDFIEFMNILKTSNI